MRVTSSILTPAPDTPSSTPAPYQTSLLTKRFQPAAELQKTVIAGIKDLHSLPEMSDKELDAADVRDDSLGLSGPERQTANQPEANRIVIEAICQKDGAVERKCIQQVEQSMGGGISGEKGSVPFRGRIVSNSFETDRSTGRRRSHLF
jgi:hypothetical protein